MGPLSQLSEGQHLKITGKRVDHPRFGMQIQVETVEASLPSNVDGIRAYLASSLVKGIGPATAEKITGINGKLIISGWTSSRQNSCSLSNQKGSSRTWTRTAHCF